MLGRDQLKHHNVLKQYPTRLPEQEFELSQLLTAPHEAKASRLSEPCVKPGCDQELSQHLQILW